MAVTVRISASGLSISKAAVTVTEAPGAGRTDTYTVALNTEPTHDVTVTVTSGDAAVATVNPGTLTFTTSNYATPRR